MLERGYILHTRPYKERSLLVNAFLEQSGLISAIVRLPAAKKLAAAKSLLQPFQPLHISYRGRTSLKTIETYEAASIAMPLLANKQFCALYINELCQRLLPYYESMAHLFDVYHQTLLGIAALESPHPVLRDFEWQLLIQVGAAPLLTQDINGDDIVPEKRYCLIFDSGFECIENNKKRDGYVGEMLLQLASNQLQPQYAYSARKLTQSIIDPLLGGKPLVSRQLYKNLKGVHCG
ncbi:DNA repair protein RecO [Paraferrimonas sp. SM1919]|uniref:DNA repair protein RecO n=1 Tax=Paraferrimonas sp. SM1919 TaxID=2662263 RepID=UPI0013CFD250|nr:DNA repair protein RecO [Paraferrimonas sp. SM1919]